MDAEDNESCSVLIESVVVPLTKIAISSNTIILYENNLPRMDNEEEHPDDNKQSCIHADKDRGLQLRTKEKSSMFSVGTHVICS